MTGVQTCALPISPAAAAITAGGHLTWLPAATGTNTIGVIVTDDGTPQLNATRSFTVTVHPAPHILGIEHEIDGDIAIQFESVAGRTYALQYKDTLADAVWQPLGVSGLAAGSTLTLTDTNPPGPRYYRVVLLP